MKDRDERGDWNPHSRRFHHDQTNITLQISETHRSKETKLIRFFRQFISQRRSFKVIIQDKQTDEVVIQASCSVHYIIWDLVLISWPIGCKCGRPNLTCVIVKPMIRVRGGGRRLSWARFLQDYIVFDFYVTSFRVRCSRNFMNFNPVTHGTKKRSQFINNPIVNLRIRWFCLTRLQMIPKSIIGKIVACTLLDRSNESRSGHTEDRSEKRLTLRGGLLFLVFVVARPHLEVDFVLLSVALLLLYS